MSIISQVRCPFGWERLEPVVLRNPDDGSELRMEFFYRQGLKVAVSTDDIDGKRWLHVSMSRQTRLPNYDDMKLVKRMFVGDDLAAYQCFPPAAQHVNLHENCLHLWAPLDGDPFPEHVQHNGT
jgi:hypothetical protein